MYVCKHVCRMYVYWIAASEFRKRLHFEIFSIRLTELFPLETGDGNFEEAKFVEMREKLDSCSADQGPLRSRPGDQCVVELNINVLCL